MNKKLYSLKKIIFLSALFGGTLLFAQTKVTGIVEDLNGPIDHATVNVNVKGMAPNININSYNWDDDFTEMLSAASAPVNPMILSNHSYGVPIAGEEDENLPACYMGAYTEDAQYIDEISRNNP